MHSVFYLSVISHRNELGCQVDHSAINWNSKGLVSSVDVARMVNMTW